jgi:hypothetical protein
MLGTYARSQGSAAAASATVVLLVVLLLVVVLLALLAPSLLLLLLLLSGPAVPAAELLGLYPVGLKLKEAIMVLGRVPGAGWLA